LPTYLSTPFPTPDKNRPGAIIGAAAGLLGLVVAVGALYDCKVRQCIRNTSGNMSGPSIKRSIHF